MRTMYFNTGCTPINSPNLHADQVWKNGTKQIPFDVDAPESATLLFLCDDPNMPESRMSGVIVREVSNTSMISKYAYLRV
jgi:hypothetical protein